MTAQTAAQCRLQPKRPRGFFLLLLLLLVASWLAPQKSGKEVRSNNHTISQAKHTKPSTSNKSGQTSSMSITNNSHNFCSSNLPFRSPSNSHNDREGRSSVAPMNETSLCQLLWRGVVASQSQGLQEHAAITADQRSSIVQEANHGGVPGNLLMSDPVQLEEDKDLSYQQGPSQ